MSYFPMFIELEGKPCLVAGGGIVAYRKVLILREFGADIRVVAPKIREEIRRIPGTDCIEREFVEGDLEGIELAVAATDDEAQNHRIAMLCRERGISVNAVDQIRDCDFIFPSYLKSGEVVAAFSSGGNSPALTQYLKERNRSLVTGLTGELAAYLGGIREEIKRRIPYEADKRELYREILALGLEQERVPSDLETEELIRRYEGEERR